MAWRHHDSSVADPFSKPNEYNASNVRKLHEVIITLRKPHPSLLYVDGLSHAWKHAGRAFSLKDSKGKVLTMAELLQLPNFNGCKDLPSKTEDMVTADLPCHKVLDDKENKKRKAVAKAEADATGADTQVRKVVRDKGAGKEGARKKKRVCMGTLGVHENIDAAFANEGHRDNEGGISGLETQPSPSRPA
nr:hypothetical protein [Tanacetum cinerariifolium]